MLELYEGGFVLRTTRQIRIVRSYDVTSVELDVVDDVCDGVIGTRDGAVSITDFLKGNELRVVLHQILGRR
jgi:hypothetical protein